MGFERDAGPYPYPLAAERCFYLDGDRARRRCLLQRDVVEGLRSELDDTATAFTLADGSRVQLPTMNAIVLVRSAEVAGSSVTKVPYAVSRLLLYKAALTSQGYGLHVNLLLPKFSFSTTLELAPLLGGMGVTDLFDPSTGEPVRNGWREGCLRQHHRARSHGRGRRDGHHRHGNWRHRNDYLR